jgi:hypothetical protein
MQHIKKEQLGYYIGQDATNSINTDNPLCQYRYKKQLYVIIIDYYVVCYYYTLHATY